MAFFKKLSFTILFFSLFFLSSCSNSYTLESKSSSDNWEVIYTFVSSGEYGTQTAKLNYLGDRSDFIKNVNIEVKSSIGTSSGHFKNVTGNRFDDISASGGRNLKIKEDEIIEIIIEWDNQIEELYIEL
ncbi:hypothetical protein [Chengkuizengella axinellae]|uniref:Lipoprotein n=1 Tax=Chengkuizengella axinellae TaxID=3064388 RepID=A0ABT9J3M2_9BACL|nr:hypothetical protein [Chengkuizengella sp. 2205SS18-9]MDP5276199.1 hypothetical protein [Chengkuizengella sp. 2205SS18-9]